MEAALQVLLWALVVCVTLWITWTKSRKSAATDTPQVPGCLPFIGHLHRLGEKQPLVRTLSRLADEYGPLITIWLGVRPIVIVSSWELAKECFTTNDKALATRPTSIAAFKYMCYDYALFAFSPYGSFWREIRKMATLELLSSRRLQLMKPMHITELDLSIKHLYTKWIENDRVPVKVDMKEWFGDLTFNTIMMSIARKRYFGSNVKEDEADARKFRQTMAEFFYLGGIVIPSDAFPALEWFDIGGHIRAMKRVGKEFDSFLTLWLEEHRLQRLSAGKDDLLERDFLDVMLSIMRGPTFCDYPTDTAIKATCLTLILAATDTTAITLTWALTLLMNNHRVLENARNEIDALVGKDRNVEEEDISNLPYLQAIIKETLRLYPPGPLALPHEAMEDCKIGGYHISAGTRLLVNVWKIHRDSTIWNNPLDFQPERFHNNDIDVRGQNFELLPFGSGRRMCPGISFALRSLHLTLARVLHGFDIKTPSSSPVDMTEAIGLALSKATPLEVLLSPRLPTNHYV